MQLYALDENQTPLFALKASKHQNYFCPECSGIVRLRSGSHRRPHFFHLSENRECFQSGKSMTHLQLQYFFYNVLPKDDCFLEYRFPTIQRIADVFWKSENIVFEIQCSFITAEEVESRIQDYFKLGIQVVWILHDQCFNQRRLTAAELFLKKSPHYFSNMNSDGTGFIYDQFEVIEKGHRHRFKDLPLINPRFKKNLPIKVEHRLPHILMKRMIDWSFYFEGDHLDKCLQDKCFCLEMKEMESKFLIKEQNRKIRFFERASQFYLQVLRLLLEKASR